MRYLLMLTLLAGLVASNSAQAGASRCEVCTPAQMQARAKALGPGDHVISSLSTDTIKAFRVFDMNGGEPNAPKVLIATELSVPLDLQQVFAAAVGFYEVTNGTMSERVVVEADRLGVPGLDNASVYDVMSDFALKGRVADRLARGGLPGIDAKVNDFIKWAGELVLGYVGVADGTIIIVVVTSDGGTLEFELRVDNDTVTYRKDRSRTPDGQPIPEANSSEYAGTWYGGGNQGFGDDLVDFAQYLQQLGVTVTGGGGSKLDCTWDGKTLNCRWVPE